MRFAFLNPIYYYVLAKTLTAPSEMWRAVRISGIRGAKWEGGWAGSVEGGGGPHPVVVGNLLVAVRLLRQ